MARVSDSTQNKKSRYVQGGRTDLYNNRLGWWERNVFEKRTDDIQTVVRPGEEGRPWKIAYRIYNQDGLGWLVLQYNNIVDINEEITIGAEISLPQPSRVSLSIMVNPIGGNPVKSG